MKFIVNNRELLLETDSNDKLPNSGSIKDYLIDIEFSSEWDNLVKVAKICIDGENAGIERAVIDDKVYIDMEEHKNYAIGFIGYTLDNDEKVFQKSTNLVVIPYPVGAGEINALEESIPTPSQWEIYIAQLEQISNEAAESARAAAGSATSATQQAEEATRQAGISTTQAGIAKDEADEATRQAGIAKDEADRAERARVGFEEEVQTATQNFDTNATNKTNDYNTNAQNKLDAYNQNDTNKTNAYNSNASDKLSAYNNNATEKLNIYNSNATDKTTAFNNNATQKTTDFNTNATNKTNDFNSNATSKTTAFNENATEKTGDYNSNATEKTTAFNENAQEKLDNFNENAESYEERIEELEAQIPTGGTVTGDNITLFDSSNMPLVWKGSPENPDKYSKIKGKTEQFTTTGKNIFNKEAIGSMFYTTKSVLDTGVRITITSSGNNRFYAIELGRDELLNKQITISTKISVSASNTAQVYLFFGNATSAGVSVISDSYMYGTGEQTKTLTIPSSFPTNTDRIRILLYANSSGTGNVGDYVDYENLQVELGSATSYEPYTGRNTCT